MWKLTNLKHSTDRTEHPSWPPSPPRLPRLSPEFCCHLWSPQRCFLHRPAQDPEPTQTIGASNVYRPIADVYRIWAMSIPPCLWDWHGGPGEGQPFTHIQDGGESRWGNIRADGGEDRPADLSDVAAWSGEQGQQDVHHHLHPLWLLLHGCKDKWIYFILNLMLR